MNLATFEAKLGEASMNNNLDAFKEGADLNPDDYYTLLDILEKQAGHPFRAPFKLHGIVVHKSFGVPKGCVWPCGCYTEKEEKKELTTA